MNKEYEKEIENLKVKMLKAEEFAKKLPIFSDKILQDKIPEDRVWTRFGERYKNLHCAWGINRGLYEKGTSRNVTNYESDYYKEYLFCIYINTITIYDSHEKFDLNEVAKNLDLFHYDVMNSAFYATDDQIESLLDALCDWKEKACEQIKEHNKRIKIENLEQELAKLTTK